MSGSLSAYSVFQKFRYDIPKKDTILSFLEICKQLIGFLYLFTNKYISVFGSPTGCQGFRIYVQVR
jgi:hypothetical protein